MASYTMLGRGTPSNNNTGSTLTPSQANNTSNFGALPSHGVPMQAPYPRVDAGQAGVANRYPATAGQGNFHLSPMTPQQQYINNNNTTSYQPQQQQQPAFQFTPVPTAPSQIQQQQQQQAPPSQQNADAMRDYVANLRAQVANLKTEVDANPAAGRRLSGSTQQLQQQQMPPTAAPLPPNNFAANNNLQVHGASAAPAPARSTAATPNAHAQQQQLQRPVSATRANTASAAATKTNLASSTIGSRSPGAAGRTSSIPRKAGGKTSMAQRVAALRDELKAHEENEERLTTELHDIQGKFSNTNGELDSTRQVLFATDSNLRHLSDRHGNLEAEFKETCRQLASSNTHGETLEAQVSVFRRAKELEHHEDRLFTYFLRHCLCTSCIPGAAAQGEISNVTADVPEKLRNHEIGRLASPEENQYHCTENSAPIKLDENGKPALRIPHEVAVLVNKHFDELSSRADSQRAQIGQLNETVQRRDREIASINENCRALQNSLELLRTQDRELEHKLLLESSEKAAAYVRCDDAVRMVHLLKASLRSTLEENDRIAKELDKQLTRIQVIDANEAMHNNRHDDAQHTIEVRTTEIRQLRIVIDTMKSNEDNLADENFKLRQAATRLQEQIAHMRTRFDELSDDVSKRLRDQAERVNQIEDHTMKLATTAVQAQMAEQEASKQAQLLIDKMRSEGAETQKRTAAVVSDMHSLPHIMLPEHARTVVPQLVVSSIVDETETTTTTTTTTADGRRSPNRNKEQQLPRYGPLSPGGRLGTALAEATAYGQHSSSTTTTTTTTLQQQHHHYSDPSSRPRTPSGLNNDDNRSLDKLLSPVKLPGAVDSQHQQKPLDPTEALAAQIRATLAMNADAGSRLDAIIAHANSTIGADN